MATSTSAPFVFLLIIAAFFVGKLYFQRPQRNGMYLFRRSGHGAAARKIKPANVVFAVLIATPMIILIHIYNQSDSDPSRSIEIIANTVIDHKAENYRSKRDPSGRLHHYAVSHSVRRQIQEQSTPTDGIGDYPWGHIYKARVWCSVLTMWPERKQNIGV